ncbi:MAG: hypothetical protein U0359_14615 [Byssovorax sp.]
MKHRSRLAFAALFSLLCSTAVAWTGCGAGSNQPSGSSGTGGATAGTTTTSGAGGHGAGGGQGKGGDDIDFDAGSNDSALDPDSACATQSAMATLTKKPVDIIITVDNSGSMTEEIVGVQKNINQNFAAILEQSGLDYRVILVSHHGKAAVGQNICIEAPLSGIVAGGCTNPPPMPINNPPKFFHYSVEIASLNSWCKLTSTYHAPDQFMLAPNGWAEWLRPEAFKVFIEITDDRVSCGAYNDGNTAAGGKTAAAKFDADLLALDPAQFGDEMMRNYRHYSIVAMAYNNPPTKPYEPADPIVTGKCPTAANPGTGYQALSIMTDALRFPLCDTTSYDVVFQAIAQGVIEGAKISCDFPIPDPPPGKAIDLASVVVEYKAGGMGAPVDFMQVPDAASCAPSSFYLDAGMIHLCPETCALVQEDGKAAINVLFACEGGVH